MARTQQRFWLSWVVVVVVAVIQPKMWPTKLATVRAWVVVPRCASRRGSSRRSSTSWRCSTRMIQSLTTTVATTRNDFFWHCPIASISSTRVLMTSSSSTTDTDDHGDKIVGRCQPPVERTWNRKGLHDQIARQILRSHKMIGRANKRLARLRTNEGEEEAIIMEAQQQQPSPLSTTNNDVAAVQLELHQWQKRLQGLNTLEATLLDIKKQKTIILEPDLAALALALGLDDSKNSMDNTKPPRHNNTATTPKTRLPYRRYLSFGNIEIRVGRRAEDNDELTLSPQHRDASDWWMHAANCAGSHVVIRCGDDTLPEEVVLDAACLAANQSKCHGAAMVPVSMTRCRDIQKPVGAKPGLVRLTGKVRTVTVRMKEAHERLERLEKTARLN
jgi:predicted ribosome quality control (RQC) complex YloA/Tae2 family protein